ncbi:uncharacterized protein CLUP02_05997 [Colletotrichum lupini]|uniref:Uncharacterized protein n=1 Tax=Colletotrichum lupini TaxID=145971 RepID=A0A9Q8WEM1_9PEZI|nr:uncharacterized protein CLUP02_05997 [Colletotrichum lupini]KAK1714879.1 hypothetical protein BDP67DRAFT_30463 [Colletotrichum lupini]UQC80514.1 hypothetical protein CLUP02_05997 [Colletotrichum lupini]
MAQLTATTFSTDPALWIFTSLTAGNMHIVTATSRLETILRANRVPFKAIDLSTDDKARMLWGRRAGKDASGRPRKLPALIQEGLVLGDIVEIEEWNEYGELKQHVKIYYDEFTIPDINNKPKEIVKKKIIKKVPKGTLAAKAAAAASSSESSSSAPAPPPAPPLPKDDTSSAPAPAKDRPANTPKSPVESATTASHQSIADEAAKRAKEIRLKLLREKVQAAADKRAEDEAAAASAATTTAAEPEKKAEAKAAAEPTTATPETPRKPSVASTGSDSSAQSAKPLGLQSPTTGSWGITANTATNADALRETLQSPTTARWKPSDVDKPVTVHMGAEVASASQEEIAAVEKAEAIKEEPSQENSDEEDSEKKKIAEVEKAQVIKEEPEKEEASKKEEELKKEKEEEKKRIAEVEKAEAIKEEPEKEEAEDTTKPDVAEKTAAPKEAAATEKTSAPAKEVKAAPPAEDDDEEEEEDDDEEDDSDDSSEDSEEDGEESETETKLKATEAKKEDAGGSKAKEAEIASRPKAAVPQNDGKPVGDA